MSRVSRSSSFRSCFRPRASDNPHAPPQQPPPNLATCLYQTDFGQFSLTWSKSLFGHCLDLDHHGGSGDPFSPPAATSTATASIHLNLRRFPFWRRTGSRKLPGRPGSSVVEVFWDLSRAGFGSGPEPESGFYVAVVVDGQMALVVGDLTDRAHRRTGARARARDRLVLRREHVVGERVYATRAAIGGESRQISVTCDGAGDAARLCFAVDGVKVLSVKRLRWKFRGSERVEVDGVGVQISWDVYNWLFDDASDSHAVFMFRIDGESECGGSEYGGACGFGMSLVEMRKMRRSLVRLSGRSSSSSSMSSSASASSSVMEWASSEESDQIGGSTGFSLLVYAWRK